MSVISSNNLTSAIYSALSGVNAAQQEMSVKSDNISNTKTAGYTKKTAERTNNLFGGVSISKISRSIDNFMLKDMRNQTSDLGAVDALKDVYQRLQNNLGKPGGSSDLSTQVNNLAASLESFAATPENDVLKNQVINDAVNMTKRVNDLAGTIQNLRAYADSKIDETVKSINTLTTQIDSLNNKIVVAQANGQDITRLEDQRDQAVTDLSKKIGINVHLRANNTLLVQTKTSQTLVDSGANLITYTPQNVVGASTVYPAGFNSILLGGLSDLTTSVQGGELKGWIDARDNDLPDVATEVENFATTLRDSVNQVHNQGTAFPPQNTLTGTSLLAAGAATTLTMTGSVRIATVDATGKFVASADINLAGVAPATVGGLITAINTNPALAGSVTASLVGTAPNQTLQLVSTVPANGVALNSYDSVPASTSQVQIGGAGPTRSFSFAFGLNDFFTGTDTAAVVGDFSPSMQVRSDLAANPNRLAHGSLSLNTAFGPLPLPTTPNTAVTSGDRAVAQSLANVFGQPISFSSAGTLPTVNQTFGGYAGTIFANQGYRANLLNDQSEQKSDVLTNLNTQIGGVSGVNLDEEMAQLTIVQNAYNAAAQALKTSDQMFDQLLSIMG
jgi:flagellar hook-associated protein 1 FlgK